jgi:hypothetical protein
MIPVKLFQILYNWPYVITFSHTHISFWLSKREITGKAVEIPPYRELPYPHNQFNLVCFI